MKKGTKLIALCLLICTVFGIVLMIAGVYSIIDNENFKKYAIETEAIVTKIDEGTDATDHTYRYVYVKFFVNGTEYSGKLNFLPSGMKKGDAVKIRYDPDNPQKFRYSGISYAGLLMVPCGVIFFIVGMFFFKKYELLYKQNKRKPVRNRLILNGKKVAADVTDVIRGAYTVGDRTSSVIVCKYTDDETGAVYDFKSKNIWLTPSQIKAVKGLPSIFVYVDLNNYSKYYVDTEDALIQ